MSWAAQAWAWKLRIGLHPAEKLVLAALADRADENGGGAWPSVPTLARDTEMSRRSVQRALALLSAAGVIQGQPGAGPHGSTIWRLAKQADPAELAAAVAAARGARLAPPAKLTGCQSVAEGVPICRETPANLAPKPSPEPSPEPSPTGRAAIAAPVAGPVHPAPDAKTVLYREGLSRLMRLTGGSERVSRGLLGRCMKEARDDAALVSSVLHEAEARRPAEPAAWVKAAIRWRVEHPPASGRHPPPRKQTQGEAWLDGLGRVDEPAQGGFPRGG